MSKERLQRVDPVRVSHACVDMLSKTARDLSEAEVRDIALRCLGRREYGVEELRRKILQRGADQHIVDTVVDDLAEDRLVSDQRFTEMYIRTRARSLFGPVKIRGELRSRGVSDSVIEEFMPDEQDVWFDAAAHWAAKRCHGDSGCIDLDYAERAKLHRSLTNRGFTHEQVNVALDRLKSND